MNLDFTALNNISSEPANPTAPRTQSREQQRETEVYKKYLINIQKAEALQTEILKGVKAGVDTKDLLLKACETIAKLTDNSVFYEQVKREIKRR